MEKTSSWNTLADLMLGTDEAELLAKLDRRKKKAQLDAYIAEEKAYEEALAVRSFNCLKRAGIGTVGELVSRYGDMDSGRLREKDLLEIRNLGVKSRKEIMEKKKWIVIECKDGPLVLYVFSRKGRTEPIAKSLSRSRIAEEIAAIIFGGDPAAYNDGFAPASWIPQKNLDFLVEIHLKNGGKIIATEEKISDEALNDMVFSLVSRRTYVPAC